SGHGPHGRARRPFGRSRRWISHRRVDRHGMGSARRVDGRVAHRRAGSGRKMADRSGLLAVLAATTLFGGSLFAMLLYGPALSDPEMVLVLMRPPWQGGLTFFLAVRANRLVTGSPCARRR